MSVIFNLGDNVKIKDLGICGIICDEGGTNVAGKHFFLVDTSCSVPVYDRTDDMIYDVLDGDLELIE